VLTLVQNGVLTEFEARYERLLEPLLLAMRFHAYPPAVRRWHPLSHSSPSSHAQLPPFLLRLPSLSSPSHTHFSSIPSPCRDIFRRLVNLVAVPDLPYLRELAVNMVDGVRATPAAQLPDPSLPDAVDALAADLEACLSADEVCLRAAIHSFSCLRSALVLIVEHLLYQVDRRLSEFKTTLRDTQGQTMVAVPRNPIMRAELAEAEEEAAAAAAAGGRLLVEGGVGGSVLDKASSASSASSSSSAVAAKAGVPAGKTANAPNGGGGANGGGGGGLVGREALETHAVDTASAPDPHKSDDASDGDGHGGKDKGYLIGFG